MKFKVAFLLFITALLTGGAWGFSSDPSSFSRTLSQTSTQTNSPVVVTATFTNGGASLLRGFYYVEQIPSTLTVTPLSFQVNGQSVTNCVLESGLDGDVFPGCTPYRWVLETPAAFAQNHPLAQNAGVRITYSLSSTNAGSFALGQFSWSGIYTNGTNASFGFSDTNDLRTLSVYTAFHPASPALTATGASANNGFAFSFPAEANVTYAVEYKPALTSPTWLALTNLIGGGASAAVVDPAGTAGSRFYRVRVP